MPVPPLAPNATPQYLVHYTALLIPHVLKLRVAAQGATDATFLADLVDAMQGCMMLQDTIGRVDFQAAGSHFSVPFATIGVSGTLSNASGIGDDPESVFISLTGRDTVEGRDTRYSFFFPSNIVPLASKNRFPVTDIPNLNAVYTAMKGLAENTDVYFQLVTIGGNQVTLNTYFNRAKSGYWQRKQRTS